MRGSRPFYEISVHQLKFFGAIRLLLFPGRTAILRCIVPAISPGRRRLPIDKCVKGIHHRIRKRLRGTGWRVRRAAVLTASGVAGIVCEPSGRARRKCIRTAFHLRFFIRTVRGFHRGPCGFVWCVFGARWPAGRPRGLGEQLAGDAELGKLADASRRCAVAVDDARDHGRVDPQGESQVPVADLVQRQPGPQPVLTARVLFVNLFTDFHGMVLTRLTI